MLYSESEVIVEKKDVWLFINNNNVLPVRK